MAPVRFVVTGAAGFVASTLVRRLVRVGHAVLAWLRPGTDAWRLADAVGPSLQVFRADLRDLATPEGHRTALEALTAFRPAVVVHGAWQGVRGPARDDPAQDENVAVALRVLKVGAEGGATRFVGLGSQAEYGPKDGPISEDTPTKPTTRYGMAKLACGTRWLEEARRRGHSAAWARLFSVYGPGERAGALIPDLARALLEGHVPPLGEGTGPWDYLYEEDAAEALERLALETSAVGTFNVASGRAVPLREVISRIRDLVAPDVALPFGTRPPKPGEPTRLETDISRLVRATGFRPRFDLDTGLARTLAAIREA